MKGIVIERNGGPDVMELTELSLQKPGPGQARVKVIAAGLNFIDIYQRRGDYPVKLPYTPGLEGAGIVEEVAADVTAVKPGDRVAYTSQPGAYAEASLVKADSLIPLPESFSFEQGAAFPLQGMTAHYLINEYRRIKPGDDVLIHAAAGGMGLLLVQWAKHLGARVFGTVSSEEKAQAAKEAGADEIIFYNKENFAEATKRLTNEKGVELIIDGVGKSTFAKNLEAAARRGTVVIFGSASGPAEPIAPNSLQAKSLTVAGGSLFNYLLDREELLYRANDVLKGIQEGWLKLRIDNVLPLAQAQDAHTLLENRKSIGKIILRSDN
ncbi:MAG: quinone oxidoreductase [Candidatus Obscuribacterales bacterium]|nr:quinone oxidoreductase [Cyanobacteria bacterium SZAS LIN-5]